MLGHRLTDEQWKLIADLLPPPRRTGRPPRNARDMIDGILWILNTGAQWRDLPPHSAPSPRSGITLISGTTTARCRTYSIAFALTSRSTTNCGASMAPWCEPRSALRGAEKGGSGRTG